MKKDMRFVMLANGNEREVLSLLFFMYSKLKGAEYQKGEGKREKNYVFLCFCAELQSRFMLYMHWF
jgi:hypothetical protein